jgi:hypothetical protein
LLDIRSSLAASSGVASASVAALGLAGPFARLGPAGLGAADFEDADLVVLPATVLSFD